MSSIAEALVTRRAGLSKAEAKDLLGRVAADVPKEVDVRSAVPTGASVAWTGQGDRAGARKGGVQGGGELRQLGGRGRGGG